MLRQKSTWDLGVLEPRREKWKLGGMEGDQAWHREHQVVENMKRALQVLLFFICFPSVELVLCKSWKLVRVRERAMKLEAGTAAWREQLPIAAAWKLLGVPGAFHVFLDLESRVCLIPSKNALRKWRKSPLLKHLHPGASDRWTLPPTQP